MIFTKNYYLFFILKNVEKIYVYQGEKKCAEILWDRDQHISRFFFTSSITNDIRKKIMDIMSDIDIHNIENLKKVFEKENFEIYTHHAIQKDGDEILTRARKQEADFLYQSNLIENIKMPYDNILEYIMSDSDDICFGCVGAWKIARICAENKLPLNKRILFEMHLLLTEEQGKYGDELEEEYRGKMRNIEVSVGGHIIAVPSERKFTSIIQELNEAMKTLSRNPSYDNILIFAAKHHLKFESLHPFADGNGRIGRMLVNYILAYFGFDPLVFPAKDRQNYWGSFPKDNNPERAEKMIEYFRKIAQIKE